MSSNQENKNIIEEVLTSLTSRMDGEVVEEHKSHSIRKLPKKPTSAYCFFIKINIDKMTGETGTERLAQIREAWRERNNYYPMDMREYNRLAAHDLKRYRDELNKPVRPKKPTSVYGFFLKMFLPKYAKIFPELSPKVRLGLAVTLWARMTNSKNTEYEIYNLFLEQAANDLTRYRNELKSFHTSEETKAQFVELTSKTKTAKKKKRDPNAPKKNKSSYIFYWTESRSQTKADNPDMSSKEITTKIKTNWCELSVDEKQPYVDMSVVDKKRYTQEIACYGESNGDSDATEEKKTEKKVAMKRKRYSVGDEAKIMEFEGVTLIDDIVPVSSLVHMTLVEVYNYLEILHGFDFKVYCKNKFTKGLYYADSLLKWLPGCRELLSQYQKKM
jgi:hypothetical protein